MPGSRQHSRFVAGLAGIAVGAFVLYGLYTPLAAAFFYAYSRRWVSDLHAPFLVTGVLIVSLPTMAVWASECTYHLVMRETGGQMTWAVWRDRVRDVSAALFIVLAIGVVATISVAIVQLRRGTASQKATGLGAVAGGLVSFSPEKAAGVLAVVALAFILRKRRPKHIWFRVLSAALLLALIGVWGFDNWWSALGVFTVAVLIFGSPWWSHARKLAA